MPRIRNIKPEFWSSEQVMDCSVMARLAFIGLWNFADDEGRMRFRPRQIKAQLFPGDDITSVGIHGLIIELAKAGLVELYAVDDEELLQITGWHNQQINRPTKSKLPPPAEQTSQLSLSIHGTLTGEGKGREGKDITDFTNVKSDEPDGSHDDNSVNDLEDDATDPDRVVLSKVEPPNGDWSIPLFRQGLTYLARATGKPPNKLRSCVGRWLKATGQDHAAVFGLLVRAQQDAVADPVAWITKTVDGREPPAADNRTMAEKDFDNAYIQWVRGEGTGVKPRPEDFGLAG